MPPVRTEPRPSPASRKDFNKVISACVGCKTKKVKCSGNYPCERCKSRNLVCSFPASEQHRLYSAARIQELEARLALHESSSSFDGSSLYTPYDSRGTAASFTPITPVPQREGLSTQRITAERDIGPSQDFGDRVESLFERRPIQTSENHSSSIKPIRQALLPEGRPSIRLRRASRNDENLLILPPEDHAFELLEAIMLYFYEPQNLFDARDVSDQISGLYENQKEQLQEPTIWTLQILLVFAVGKLLRGESDFPGDLPGSQFFDFVERNLPSPTKLRKEGIAGIEVLVLMAVYLQNIDHKDDASIYAGLAFRLAIMHGLHRKETTQMLRRSESTHANRLWWTVHMLEKRLMIATGCPLISDDTFVDALLPTDSPGLPNPSSIQINIQIAQIQGRIYSVIYSNESRAKEIFLADVQEIIASLTRLAHQISHTPSLAASVLGHQTSRREQRTSISLYTVLCTTIMLTLRPVMLHLTKSILNGETTFAETPKDLQQLSYKCIEAARRSLELMLVSRKENMIAIFGFFDLDTIFSGGFIMLLAAIIESTNNKGHQISLLRPTPGISEAIDLLDYLGSFNNQAAIQRRDQIQKLYNNIPSLMNQSRLSGGLAPDDEYHRAATGESTLSANPIENVSSLQVGDGTSGVNSNAAMEGYTIGSLPIEFPDDPQAMYSLYHPQDFTLTGGDIADFEELERHLFGNDS